MISRLWYFILAAALGAGIAGAFIAQETLDHRESLRVREQLRRDRAELELWLRYDARARIDSLGPMAAHQDVRAALATASNPRRRGSRDEDQSTLGATLAGLNQQLEEGAAQLLFALDVNGVIVAQLGGTTPPLGAGLGQFPVVQRALSGYLSDDVLVYNGAVFRAAARPVVQGGRYVGAIVHCSEIGAQLAARLGSRLSGASLGFFFRGDIIASHTPGGNAGLQEMQSGLVGALDHPELADGGHTEPIDLSDSAVGVYSYVRGTARHAHAGYVLARPIMLLGSPMAMFDSIPETVMAKINWPLAAGLPLLLALLGLLFMFLEHDRPLRKFRAALSGLGEGSVSQLNEAALPARFRKMGHDVNEGLSRTSGVAAPKPAANLDEILGDSPSKANPYFGFAGADQEPDTAASPFAPPAAPLIPPHAPPPVSPPVPPPSAPSAIAPPAPQPPSRTFDDESDATHVAMVPEELLAAVKADSEEEHFRSVYEDFIAMKTKCGEPTAGVTYEKLVATLRKNAAAIRSKHNVPKVRFTVYEKNGKAALKATPVRR